MYRRKFKILSCVVSLLIVIFCFVSCTRTTHTEAQEIEAIITGVYYEDKWSELILIGQFSTSEQNQDESLTHYSITLTVGDKDIYDYYKEKIGTVVKCDLITEYYKDGSIQQTVKLKHETVE